ncbi:MAG: EAL domain-containing protein [Cyanobacteria bacterium SBLK]|nr:EAL domain-containing protein [Cyanobacteria bacterium SBLK]
MLQISANLQDNTNVWEHHWTQSELKALNLARSPIWIVDADKRQICWGNDAALKLWNIPSISSLKNCDFASKLPAQLRSKLRSRSKSRQKGRGLSDTFVNWTFEREQKHFSLRCHCSRMSTTSIERAILVQGTSPISEINSPNKTNPDLPKNQTASNSLGHLVEFRQESEPPQDPFPPSIPELVSRHAPDGKILAVSAACKQLLGYEPEELVGLSPHTFIHPRDIALLKASYQKIAAQPTATMTYQMRHKAGHYLPMETIGQMVGNAGKSQEILAISRPLGDGGEIANLLSQQNQILEAIATDRDLEEILRLLLQVVESQLAGRAIAIVLLDDRGKPILEIANREQGKCGTPRWRSTPIFDSCNAILGLLLVDDSSFRILSPEEEHILRSSTHLAAIAIERQGTAKELERAEAQYRSIFENSPVGIFQTSPEGHYLNANLALAQIYGHDSPGDLMMALTDVAHQLYVDPQRRRQFIQLLQEKNTIVNFESRVYRRDGSTIWISENTRAVRDNNGVLLYYEGTVQEITARRQAEERLRHLALHDDLTQLPNRSFFLKYLEAAIASHNSDNAALSYAVLFIDLDRFKDINDSLGHRIGDELLKAVAKRLRGCLASRHAIARFGGDEFAVLLQAIAGVDEAIETAENLLAQLDDPFQINAHELFIRGSIGIVTGNPDYTHPESLLRDADIAMYRAKQHGKGRYKLFDPQMQIQTHQNLQLENDLRRGLDREEFGLYYQPIMNLSSGKLQGFEALVRWNHPQRGLVLPDEFIPLAEENGAIEQLGQFILAIACRQLHQWQENIGIADRDFQLNVNLSPRQLDRADFCEQLAQICAKYPIACQHLKLEITESCLLETDALSDRCRQLKADGMSLCIDDFGMGYSSLSRLHEFPIDTIKIDRSFVKDLQTDSHSLAIVKTIVTLARGLGMDLVAEGVENLAQIDILKSLGCELAQGYFFSPPIPAEIATQWVEKNLQKV